MDAAERIQILCSTPVIPESPLRVIRDALSGDRGEDQQRIAEVGAEWLGLLLAKNQDYGSSAWKRPILAQKFNPSDAILVRMSDKIERLHTLMNNRSAQVADESIEDTVRDLGAYCLLWLARPSE